MHEDLHIWNNMHRQALHQPQIVSLNWLFVAVFDSLGTFCKWSGGGPKVSIKFLHLSSNSELRLHLLAHVRAAVASAPQLFST